ncbi:response regulator transcription factor [Pseudomonas sp. 18175]|uniref:response regulator transcription factor n=1 Tax=Pseudomonas sp. 18175 TaxID=3390056 RepID=UPI003D23DCE8
MSFDAVCAAPIAPSKLAQLTRREQQVANRIASGQTSKQIAKALGISDLTVRKHRQNLYRKLGLQNLTQLLRYCLDPPAST